MGVNKYRTVQLLHKRAHTINTTVNNHLEYLLIYWSSEWGTDENIVAIKNCKKSYQ